MATFKNQSSGVLNNCMATLEKISKDDDGMNEIVQSGGNATLIATLDFGELDESKPEGDNTNQNDVDLRFLKPAFALMRLCW